MERRLAPPQTKRTSLHISNVNAWPARCLLTATLLLYCAADVGALVQNPNAKKVLGPIMQKWEEIKNHVEPWGEYHAQRHQDCPSMFVFVMSSRKNAETRQAARQMWFEAHAWGNLKAKFAICDRPSREGEDSALAARLLKEQMMHDDLYFLDCEEGYMHGMLTRKVLSSMEAFLRPSIGEYELFMKTDDDAFISPLRLCDFLSAKPDRESTFNRSYIGVFAEANEDMYKRRPPCRDDTSAWYEPYENFAEEFYPITAKGGPGYIISRYMVQGLVNDGIARTNLLNNEDRAIAVWIDQLVQRGMQINYVNVPGTDGYEAYHPGLIRKSGEWYQYPYAIHHHLQASEIECLHDVEKRGSGFVDGCFIAEQMALAAISSTRHREDMSEATRACLSGA